MIYMQNFCVWIVVFAVTHSQVKGARKNAAEREQYIIKVEIGNTTVKGIQDQTYFAFRGIPYAVPPVGESRWKDPILQPMNINDEIDATKYNSVCSQWSRRSQTKETQIGSENCLFLNIFTKFLPDFHSASRPLDPVIVYIHGGGFQYASGDVVGPEKFVHQNVTFVTINYRLGVFGFLSTGDEEIPGNFGLLDQVVALEWIQKYIKYFGGDPRRVTIFGHSAGSASVHLLTLSPRTRGLFHRAIIISGNGLCDWATEQNPLEYVKKVGKLVGCPTDDSTKDLAQCLRTKSTETLTKAQEDLLDFWVLPAHTVGVVDANFRNQPFLPDTPLNILKNGNFAPVPILTGVVQDEGFMGYAILHLLVGNDQFRNTPYFLNQLIPRILRNTLKFWKNEQEIQLASEIVRRTYFNDLNMTNEDSFKIGISETNELFGDILFYSCHRQMLEEYSKLPNPNQVYSFVFSHKTIESPKIISRAIENLRKTTGTYHPLFDFSVPHVEDMFYLFNWVDQVEGNLGQKLSEWDHWVSDNYTNSLVTFATTGTPSNVPWRPIRPGTINYYNFTQIPSPMGENFRKRESQFWFHTIPYVQKLGNDITEAESQSGTYYLVLIILAILAVLFIIISIGLGLWIWHLRTTGKANILS